MHETKRQGVLQIKLKKKLQILKRSTVRHPTLISDNILMVRCCTKICLLPSKTCEALFKNRGKKSKFEGIVKEQAMLLRQLNKKGGDKVD